MTRVLLLVCALLLAPAVSAVHGQPTRTTEEAAARDLAHYNLKPGKPAIEGYDPVAYFPEGGGKAAKGQKSLALTHRGVTYWFSTQSNFDRFKANPDRFEPTYGGWCATAMADGGRKVEIDPTNFTVTEGRLFLFYKSFFQNALDVWKQDEAAHTKSADESWQRIAGEAPRR